MNSSDKIQVGVIFGGRSGEHEVSLVSAQSIIKALDPAKFNVVPIGITKQGSWLVGAEPQGMLTAGGGAPQLTADSGRPAVIGDPTHKGMVLLNGGRNLDKVKLDVIFPVVHGTYGEDGTLQGMLELADIPYVGCGVLASSVGMDKTSAKRIFRDAGLPITPFHEYLRKDWREKSEATLDEIEMEFGYPCFIKPVNSGSSVGISKAHDRVELAAAMTLAARYDRKILVEAFINGREIEVSVLGNDDPIASVAGEVIPCHEFYDYEAKYIDDRSELKIPAPVSAEKMKEIQGMAVAAYRAIDGAGMARVDFFLERGTDRLVLNEVNTIPGFTSISMYPKMWEASGISYPDLVNRLVQLAFERHADKRESLKAVV
ncbi:MAG: D-alanine--D-alanine ligase [Candidatus Riflebacteria bacterium]|nr:D-alanine--D-alanine ligase [Candidatus Riflebacteria bacterium]